MISFSREFKGPLLYNQSMDDQGFAPTGDDAFDAKLSALAEERSMTQDSIQTQGEELFKQHLIQSVLGICNLSMHATNEKLRFDAQKYVVERVIGRLGDVQEMGEDDPLEKLARSIQESLASGNL